MRRREGEQKERVRLALGFLLWVKALPWPRQEAHPGRSWGFILLGCRVRSHDKWDIRGHSRRGQALQRGPSKRPQTFPEKEGTRPGEPRLAPPLASPLPDSVTMPPHNELLFSI